MVDPSRSRACATSALRNPLYTGTSTLLSRVLNAPSLPTVLVGTVVHALAIAWAFVMVSRKVG